MGENQMNDVIQFYDSHPISEHQILEKLHADGYDQQGLSVDILQNYDQDHFGGVEANDLLAALAGINGQSHVLDVCSGMGGPSRYIALQYGCTLTGIDLTQSRVEGARRLTALVGLENRVGFQVGNALEMPFGDQSFDAVMSQEAFCHIPDKARLVSQCVRVLKPGGRIAFTDIMVTKKAGTEVKDRLQKEMAFQELGSFDVYRQMFEKEDCPVEHTEDLGPLWRDILIDRLAMYRGLKDQTIDRFGQTHFEKWDSAYANFVGLFKSGELTGGRIMARRGQS